jgi:hypothetical protein
MSTQPTITEILPRIELAVQRVVQSVSSMSPAQTGEPRLAEGRSVKDVLGHLTCWDQWLLVTLPPAADASAVAITLPLADQIPPTHDWAEEINAKVRAYYEPRAFSAIWEELTVTCDRLLRRVSQLSDSDLYDPAGIAAIIGQPVAPLICGIYEHYDEHAHEFERLP